MQAMAALKRPTVKLYRGMSIENPCAPNAKMMLRAYPFRGQAFHGIQREVGDPHWQVSGAERTRTRVFFLINARLQDCFAAVPEDSDGREIPVQQFKFEGHEGDTWVGTVICFFKCMVRTGSNREEQRQLAFVRWADDYLDSSGDGETRNSM